MLDIVHDIERYAPNAYLLNYTNPMAMLCRTITRESKIPMVGLCHSVQGTAEMLAGWIGAPMDEVTYTCAGINHMAGLVQAQLKSIMDALENDDADKAVEVWRSDRVVDDIYNALFREVITYMMEDPRNITPCTHLLFIAKNLERMGDHATNIAETIYYAVTGQVLPDARPKGDASAYAVVRPKDGE